MKPAIENVLEKAAGLAAGLILVAVGGGSAVAVEVAGAAVSGVALWAMIQGSVRKVGLDSRATVEAIRQRAFLSIQRYEDRLDVEEANAALAELLPSALPTSDALIDASFDPDGFPARATILVMDELGRLNGDLFGPDAPGPGREFAREIVSAALKAALETPEYFQKLQPYLTLGQNQRLAQIQKAVRGLEIKIDARFDALESKLADYLREAVAAGAAASGQKAGLSAAQVEALLVAFGHQGVPIDQAEGLLVKAAAEINELRLRLRLARLSNGDPEVARLKAEASAAIDASRLEDARSLLLQAAARDKAAAEELHDAVKARSLSASESLSDAGKLSRAQARFLEAADLFAEAAALAKPFDADAARAALSEEAGACYEHGVIFPGLTVLGRAISLWRAIIDDCDDEDASAAAQNSLGNALANLGGRLGGTAGAGRLAEAVAAYEAALRVRTEKDMPAQWAGTQNNLGNALASLGERLGGAAGAERLAEAVAAFEAAQRVYTEKDMPADWAMTKNNLGNALRSLGDRLGGAAGAERLAEAVAAFEAALRVRTKKDMPAQWAGTQNNLGNALGSLGERLGGAAGVERLAGAVAAFEAALWVRTEKDMPTQWAATQNNLGNALRSLGERLGGAAGAERLAEAVAAFEAALRVYTEMDMPAQWAATQTNLGIALENLGERLGGAAGAERLARAVGAFEAALRIYSVNGDEADAERLREEIAQLRKRLT